MSKPSPRRPLVAARRPITGPSSSSLAPARKPGQPSSSGGRVGVNARGTEEGYLYVAGVRDPSKRMSEYRTDQDVCPVCHTDRQFNKNLRLLVSPCYHKMCESCIDRLFTLGPEPCPQCGRILRKVNFAHQTFEDLKVEKEVAVRRRMAEHFNKTEADFLSKREYDNYLEEVEDLTFNLLNDIDIPETEARIAEFSKKNAAVIEANKERAALELLGQAERDEVERRARDERRRLVAEAEEKDRAEAEENARAITLALGQGNQALAEEIRQRGELAKKARQEALDKAVPSVLMAMYNSLSSDSTSPPEDLDPLSASYTGPFVPMPYSDPDKAEWKQWYTLKDTYADGRDGVIAVKENRKGAVRPGGFDLSLFWEMEIRSAVESLGIEPIRDPDGGAGLMA